MLILCKLIGAGFMAAIPTRKSPTIWQSTIVKPEQDDKGPIAPEMT
jgi:hypothetical protein